MDHFLEKALSNPSRKKCHQRLLLSTNGCSQKPSILETAECKVTALTSLRILKSHGFVNPELRLQGGYLPTPEFWCGGDIEQELHENFTAGDSKMQVMSQHFKSDVHPT